MFFDCDEFFFRRVLSYRFRLGFIEKTQLALDVIRTFFTGTSEKFLCEIVDLLLKSLLTLKMFLFAFVGCIDQTVKIADRLIQFLYGIFQLYELLIPGIFCHCLPPEI